MKQRLFFSMAERGVVLSAMRSYIPKLKRSEKPAFEMTLEKVKKTQFPLLDGMEMICLVIALTWRSGMFAELGKHAEQLLYLDLSNSIDDIRREFQYRNSPEIIKAARAAVS
jgi:hypothetical protein